MKVAQKFRAIRAKLHLNQKQLAVVLEIKQNSLSMIELGNNNCTLELAAKFFNKLNVNPIWFFQDKGEMFIRQDDFPERHAELMERAFNSLNRFPLKENEKGWLKKPFAKEEDNQGTTEINPVAAKELESQLLEAIILLDRLTTLKKFQIIEHLALSSEQVQAISTHATTKYPVHKITADFVLQYDNCHLSDFQNVQT